MPDEHRPSTVLSRVCSDKTVIIRSEGSVRCLCLSPSAQALALFAASLLAVWLVIATAHLALEGVDLAEAGEDAVAIAAAHENRVGALLTRIEALEAERADAEARARDAAETLTARHDALAEATAQAQAESARGDALEAALAEATLERDALRARADGGEAEAAALERRLAAAEAERNELADTLMRIAGALDDAATAREDAEAAARKVVGALGALEAGVEEERDRQARLLSEIERAAELSIVPLESMLRSVGVDVDRIVSELRGAGDGQGGPFIADPDPASAPQAQENAFRATAVIADLERVRALRAATERMPFAVPVRHPRFTSGFGARRDPFTRARALHDGLDMAGPVGTPVMAPANGVVEFAGTQRGYGRMIRIRHDFGFETLYAHLSRVRVEVGQRVKAGQRIGDMGNTGRSTGSHLHYEIHVNGRPVNPMKFIEAARNVL